MYRTWLERLYGFHAIWEPQVAAALNDPAFFEPRRKLALLAADLGDDANALATLPRPTLPTPLATVPDALGSMYVLEGSTLGGQLIARHVRATLGLPAHYHAAYGPRSGAMWRGFQDKLGGTVAAKDEDRVLDAARATFVHLREWLAR